LKRPSGFTLLEVLVAMAVLAICLTVIMELFSGGLKSGYLSKEYIDAVYLAREKMEEILTNDQLEEHTAEGEGSGVFRWQTEVHPVEEAEEAAPQLPFRLFEIRVKVLWKEGERQKSYMIHTLKIASVPPQATVK